MSVVRFSLEMVGALKNRSEFQKVPYVRVDLEGAEDQQVVSGHEGAREASLVH